MITSAQLSKNLFFTELKLKLHGFHQIRITWTRSGTAIRKCSIENLFRKISQTSEENIFIGATSD